MTQNHPTTSSTLCRVPHPKNEQNKNTNWKTKLKQGAKFGIKQ